MNVLIVYYSLGGNTEAGARAVREGIENVEGVTATMKAGPEATLDDLLGCDGIVIGSPDYFDYMAGGLKDFFDRTVFPSKGKVTGKPYFAFLTHGGGGAGIKSIEKIAGAFGFRKTMDPVLFERKPDTAVIARLRQAGAEFARIITREC